MRAFALFIVLFLQFQGVAYAQDDTVDPQAEWSKGSGCNGRPEIKNTQRVEWYKNVESNTLIVFIHGIFSDNRTAWLADNCAYFPEMLSSEFPDASVILGGFYTAPASGSYDAVDAAQLIWDRLNDSVNSSGMRPIDRSQIIFVAHSTGGLVARQIIAAHPQAFVGKRVGLALLASPTRGSAWADVFSPISSLAGNTLAQELETDSQFLKTIDVDFQTFRTSPNVDVRGVEIVEQKFLIKQGWWLWSSWHWTLVDRASGAVYFGPAKVKPNANHFEVAKPIDKNDDTFLWTKAFYINNFARDVSTAHYHYPNVASLTSHFTVRTPVFMDVDVPRESLDLPDKSCQSKTDADQTLSYTCHLERNLAAYDGFVVAAASADIERADGRPVTTVVRPVTSTSVSIDVRDLKLTEGETKVKFFLREHLKIIAKYNVASSTPDFKEYAAGDTISLPIPYGADEISLEGTIAGHKVSLPYRATDPSGWIRWVRDDRGEANFIANWEIDRPH